MKHLGLNHIFFAVLALLMMSSKGGCLDEVEVDDGFDGGDEGEGEGIDKDKDLFQNVLSTSIGPHGYKGLDMLVVIDNSGSMEAEQRMLATSLYSMVTSLTNPLTSDDSLPPVTDIKIAFVSTDMGLQYGEEGSIEGFPYGVEVQGCTNRQNRRGDDGDFLGMMPSLTTIFIESNQVRCEAGGGQCPIDFICNSSGYCESPDGNGTLNCPDMRGLKWTETARGRRNNDLALEAACLAHQGTKGCGIEQQLEAAVRALEKNPDFLEKGHVLLVLMVTDEEDCSVESKQLFGTTEYWSGAGKDLNTACNWPEENNDYLFDTERYYSKLVELKENRAEAVFFGAIVGVPAGGDSPCQGTGSQISAAGCLSDERMELEVVEFDSPQGKYRHFDPACERFDATTNEQVTAARPARRIVEVAQRFGPNGYVYSICNADWSPAMKEIGRSITQSFIKSCYPERIDWSLLPDPGPNDNGLPECNLFMELELPGGEAHKCPSELYFGEDYESRVFSKSVEDEGRVIKERLFCPVQKLPAPLDCLNADALYQESSEVGWYYCESTEESFNDACGDGIDNDKDGDVDCDDTDCAGCQPCGGSWRSCELRCRYNVNVTAQDYLTELGGSLIVQCPLI